MAVIQVSSIQVRSGLQENLPALATGEFGWSVDTQRLFIGKGTLAEGAPMVGVTEILTEYSVGLISELSSNVANLQAQVTSIASNVTILQSSVLFLSTTLADNISTAANVTYSGNNVIQISTTQSNLLKYNIVRGTTGRVGSITVTNSNGVPTYSDEYSDTSDTGVILSFANIGGKAILQYTTTSTGSSATFNYQINTFIV